MNSNKKIFLVVGEFGENEGKISNFCAQEIAKGIDSLIPRKVYVASLSTNDCITEVAHRLGFDNDYSLRGIRFLNQIKTASMMYNHFPFSKIKRQLDKIKAPTPCSIFINCFDRFEASLLQGYLKSNGYDQSKKVLFHLRDQYDESELTQGYGFKGFDSVLFYHDDNSFDLEAFRFCTEHDLYDHNSLYRSQQKRKAKK